MRPTAILLLPLLLSLSALPSVAQGTDGALWEHRSAVGNGSITWMELGGDGRTLVVAYEKGYRQWNIQTGQLVAAMHDDYAAPMYPHDLSPGGEYVATTRGGGAGEIWIIDTRDQGIRLRAGGRGRLLFTDDGAYIVHIDDSTIEMLRMPHLELAWRRTDADYGDLVATSRDATMMLFLRQGVASLHAFNGGTLIRRLDGWNKATHASFALGSSRVVGYNGTHLAIWDAGTGVLRKLFTDGMRRMVMRPGGRLAVTMALQGPERDSTVRVWDIESEARIRDYALRDLRYPLYGAVLTPDERHLVVAETGGSLALVDIMTGAITRRLFGSGEEGAVGAVAVSRDGRTIATGSRRPTIRSAVDGAILRTISTYGGRIEGIAFDPAGDYIAVASTASSAGLAVYGVGTGALIYALPQTGATDVAWSPDGNVIALATRTAGVRLFESGSGGALAELTLHKGAVTTVAFSPDGRWLASGGEDRTVKLWEASSRALARTYQRHVDTVLDVLFTPDSRSIISAGNDNLAFVHSLDGSSRGLGVDVGWAIHSLAQSPDGALVHIGAADDRTVDLATGRLMKNYANALRHTLGPRMLATLPGSGALLVGTPDGDLIAWRTADIAGVEHRRAAVGSIAPNPARDNMVVTPALERPASVRARLFGATGELSLDGDERPMMPGEQIVLDVSRIASGVYQLELIVDGERRSATVSVVR